MVRIANAVAEVNMVPTCAVFLRGPSASGARWIVPAWAELSRILGRGGVPPRCRRGTQTQWSQLPGDWEQAPSLFDGLDIGAGCRRVEVASGEGSDRIALEWVDLLPILGNHRASHLCVRFARDNRPGDAVRFAEWVIQNLPLYWGSAGFTFEHVSGPRHIAYTRIAAMAKRYWGVQILDLNTLQWDALTGMPGVNWLTLVGNEFAASRGVATDSIGARAAVIEPEGVYHRQAAHGLALAAGPAPLLGDINLGDDMRAYALVVDLVRPLVLLDHLPLAGPFAHREVMTAWLQRFESPEAWLRCDIGNRAR